MSNLSSEESHVPCKCVSKVGGSLYGPVEMLQQNAFVYYPRRQILVVVISLAVCNAGVYW